ncbi:purine-binding chemotaxis protein CheW, partial [Parageobacillus sp. SY1]
MEERSSVLLESGTNELEIVEFLIATNRFAINVMKVREIVKPAPITKIPHSHPHIEGIIELRGEVLPVVDLAKVLHFPPSENPEHDKFIVAEFN